jgi:hypothetical protein
MALMPPPITSQGRAAVVGALRTIARFDPFGRYAPRLAERDEA